MEKEYAGLKILGILSLIGGLLCALAGLVFLASGSAITEAGQEGILEVLAFIPLGASLMIIGGAMFIIGLVVAFIGYKVYKHVRWAYWVYFTLTVISFLLSLASVSWFGILIGGIIIWYLYSIHKSFLGGADVRRAWSD